MKQAIASVRRAVIVMLVLLPLPAMVVAQDRVSVVIRVVDAQTSNGIAGASLEIAGTGRGISDATGQFRFAAVPQGPQSLSAIALGYQSRTLAFTLTRDTTITVQLAPLPVRLDSVLVRSARFSIRGTVRSGATIGVPDADVFVGREYTLTSATGTFSVTGVPAYSPIELRIEAIGYLPVRRTLELGRDTLLDVLLEPDPVGQRMVAQQLRRLENRLESVLQSTRNLKRADLLRHSAPTLFDALRINGVQPRAACIIVDEMPKPYGIELLASLRPEEIERVEVIRNGQMLRVYTYRFLRRELPGKRYLQPAFMDRCA